jgi:hypothetical protein
MLALLIPIKESLLTTRLPYSSNRAAIEYTVVNIGYMRALQKADSELCYNFTYGAFDEAHDFGGYADQELRQKNRLAENHVIKSSYENTQKPPSDAEVENDLNAVLGNIYSKYGDNAEYLSNPYSQDVDKSLLCEMTIDLYDEIVGLPEDNAGRLLRYMYVENTNAAE